MENILYLDEHVYQIKKKKTIKSKLEIPNYHSIVKKINII